MNTYYTVATAEGKDKNKKCDKKIDDFFLAT